MAPSIPIAVGYSIAPIAYDYQPQAPDSPNLALAPAGVGPPKAPIWPHLGAIWLDSQHGGYMAAYVAMLYCLGP